MSNSFDIKKIEGKDFIYDTIRKKYVSFTPEEWVRQSFIKYLIEQKNYPASLFSVEKIIKIGEVNKRFDILIYKNMSPWMLVECKREDVNIDEKSLVQILAYQSKLSVKYLTITNGKTTFCFDIEQGTWIDLPNFEHD